MIRFPAIGSVIAVRVLAVIALVIFLSQLAIVMVFWHMAQRQAGAEYRLPLPARVASIVEIVEATAPEDRTTLLQAMNGPDLAVRIVPELTETERLGRRRIPVFRRAVEGYSEILQDREENRNPPAAQALSFGGRGGRIPHAPADRPEGGWLARYRDAGSAGRAHSPAAIRICGGPVGDDCRRTGSMGNMAGSTSGP